MSERATVTAEAISLAVTRRLGRTTATSRGISRAVDATSSAATGPTSTSTAVSGLMITLSPT